MIRPEGGTGPGAGFNPAWLAGDYAQGGAAALPVLTDARFFLGANELFVLEKATGQGR